MKGWRENAEMVWLVAWRELRDQLRDWRILLPMLVLTFILPFLANFGAVVAMNFTARYGTPLIAERLVPFLLMVVGFFPITVSLVIALESFVGEKERGTIEPLLASPLKDWQLFLGKLLAGTAAPLLTSYLGITIYLIGLRFQHIPLPDANRMVETIFLTTVQAFLMVSGAILISTQATSVRASNLMASFIIIPMSLLIQGESVMLFWGNDQVLWLAVVGVSILTLLLGRVGIAHFQREVLLGREIDVLNLRWVWQTFWQAFKGKAARLGEWYRCEVRQTLSKQRIAILFTVVLGVAAAALGYGWASANLSPLPPGERLTRFADLLPTNQPIPWGEFSFLGIWGHNLRALALSFLLGLFSFGVLGMLIYVLNTVVIGLTLMLVKLAGYSPLQVSLWGILPHGLFEIPALILASAAVLYIGIALVTPRSRQTLGEVLIESVAHWLRVAVGVVLPLLTLAALIEATVTPWLLSNFVK